MKFKVKGGTPKGSGNPCASCVHWGQRTYENGRADHFCTAYNYTEAQRRPLVAKVVDCSWYREKGAKSVSDYEKTAWILRPEKGGRKIGFTRYSSLTKDEKDQLDEELFDLQFPEE